MSGTPTEAEIQTQWRLSVDLLEKARVFADGKAGNANEFQTLIAALEGEYTPAGILAAIQSYRAGLSDLISPARALEFISPSIFEYGKFLADNAAATGGGTGFGSAYETIAQLMDAIYEHFVAESKTVDSRAISYDLIPIKSDGFGSAIVGNGAITRLTVDENGFNLESCTVERKTWRCRRDQNSGTKEEAEEFEVIGEAASPDNLLRSTFGSGTTFRTFVRSLNAGTGDGGSLLRNSSFSTFDNAATPKFVGWDQSFTGGAAATDITQVTGAGNFYRSHPGASSDGSCQLTAPSSGNITLTQTLASMRISQLDANRPYFLRVMYKPASANGTLRLVLGAQDDTVSVTGSGWKELIIAADANTWFRKFNKDGFSIAISWESGTTGTLLLDDVIFAPYTLIDGTYWAIRGNDPTHVPWKLNDTLEFEDTGGAPAGAKIQYWNWIAGLRSLPSTTGTPTFTEP